MKHRRFYVSAIAFDGERIICDGDTIHRMKRVLRLACGDEVCIIDGTGYEYNCVISEGGVCDIISKTKCDCDPSIALTLLMAYPKGDKADFVVQKATELGASRIIFMQSEYVVSFPDEKTAKKKLERRKKIACEASEQCLRATVPTVDEAVPFGEAIRLVSEHDAALIAWEDEQALSIKEALRQKKNIKSIIIAVGCEGGFSQKEIDAAKALGWQSVTMGKRIFRAETAAIAVCAQAMYELEL